MVCFVFVFCCLIHFEVCLYRPFCSSPLGLFRTFRAGVIAVECRMSGIARALHQHDSCKLGCLCSRDTQISLGQFSFRNKASVCTASCGKVRSREGL